MKKVYYVFPVSHHYRYPFHERLRERLSHHDIDYRVVYSDPREENLQKSDTVDIAWGIKVPTTAICGISYQHALGQALKADLVIVQQESRLALNYLLNIASIFGIKRVAYFGHGRNFQARDPKSRAERWKRFWATKVDWWFAYTDETRKHIESLSFPGNRITVFNNAVDTSLVHQQVAGVTPEQIACRRKELDLHGAHVGVFVGGLYEEKRLDFLIESALHIRNRVPDFELIVIGGGPALENLRVMSNSLPWVHILGPKFGLEKVEIMLLGQLFLMPGLVGLAILDAAAVGLPMVTTAFPWHSPEIAYLEDGISGVIVQEWKNPVAYGDAVADLLLEPARLIAMKDSARALSNRYNIEFMAIRFAEGVVKALSI